MPEETPEQQSVARFLAEWGETLDEVEQNLRAALRAFEQLRAGIESESPPRFRVVQQKAPAPARPAAVEPVVAAPGGAHAPFERLWDRLEQERVEKQQPAPEEVRRGLDLLPRQYLMTVEDREQTVDLVPLHRALVALTGVQEISLVSFANGVPVVSVRTDRELDLEQMGRAVELTMDRTCEVIPQDTGRIFIRLKPAADRGV